MSYISRHLLPGEHILYKGEISIWFFLPSLLWTCAGFAMVTMALASDPKVSLDDEKTGLLMLGGSVIFLIAIVRLIRLLFYNWTSEFVVTDKRCILKTGLISISVSDIALDKCEGIEFRQSIMGRIFRYGTLLATTGGQTQAFPGISDPFEFRNMLFVSMDDYKKGCRHPENQ